MLALVLGWPCLRVRGPYFVILTLGVSEFVKYLVISSEAALGRNGRLLIGTPSLTVLFEAMLALAGGQRGDAANCQVVASWNRVAGDQG